MTEFHGFDFIGQSGCCSILNNQVFKLGLLLLYVGALYSPRPLGEVH
jgi:hypothetical protein